MNDKAKAPKCTSMLDSVRAAASGERFDGPPADLDAVRRGAAERARMDSAPEDIPTSDGKPPFFPADEIRLTAGFDGTIAILFPFLDLAVNYAATVPQEGDGNVLIEVVRNPGGTNGGRVVVGGTEPFIGAALLFLANWMIART